MAAASGYVDLRSDTVTRPSPAMRQAMATAEVGDDLFGDDPTVNRLQDRAAELTGRQAGLYLPTGTLCNQIAMHAFARAGHFVACEATAHVAGMEVLSARPGRSRPRHPRSGAARPKPPATRPAAGR